MAALVLVILGALIGLQVVVATRPWAGSPEDGGEEHPHALTSMDNA